jgi:hypothetical protein
MNYAEQLSRIYLRLNGFFLMENFVQHGVDHLDHGQNTADVDIVAIRMPHSLELIDSQPLEQDPWFQDIGLSLTESKIGLIVEVKSGSFSHSHVKAFMPERLSYSLRMMGFLRREDEINEVVQVLETRPIYSIEDITFANILISENKVGGNWYQLSIDHLNAFIRYRIEKFSDTKWRDRMFFPSEIMQYMIWETKRR